MHLDLTSKERAAYSIVRAITAQVASNPRAAAPFEYELSDTIRQKAGSMSLWGGVCIPSDVLFAKQRALVTTTGSAGGYLKEAEVPTFQAALREVSWLEKVPLQRFDELKGDQAVPRHASNVTTTWLGTETTAADEQTPSFGSVALTPKTVSVVVDRSRQHLLQSPSQEAQLLRELGLSVGAAVATACANGSGADGQPTGLLGQTSQSVSGTTLSWANTCELIRLAEAAGGGDNLAVLIGTTAAKTLRTREKAAGSGYILADGRLDSVPAIVTNTMPADALLVGNFGYAIYATWAPALEIVATAKASRDHFMAGLISIRAIASLDIGAVHPAAFAKCTSIT